MMPPHPLCYLCGRGDPDSRDHVPARALFYPRLPDDLMTAPAHRSCQGSFSRDEEYFAAILDEAIWQGCIVWTNVRPQRSSRPGHKPVTVPVDAARVEAVIKKIIQGLHFRCMGRLLSPQTVVIIRSGRWVGNSRQPLQFQSRGNYGEFKYAYRPGKDGRSTWILVFHDQFMFRCEVTI